MLHYFLKSQGCSQGGQGMGRGIINFNNNGEMSIKKMVQEYLLCGLFAFALWWCSHSIASKEEFFWYLQHQEVFFE